MPQNPDPPRVALIGCGLVGQKRLKLLPPGSVTVACDLQLERAQKLAAQSPGCLPTDSVEQAVGSPNVDVVMIATANASLAPIAVQAAQHGKHVLVEKPGAIAVKELDTLEAAGWSVSIDEFPAVALNRVLRGRDAGTFRLCATVQTHRGCLDGEVTP